MNKRRIAGITLTMLALLFGTAVPALAGGWAVITLDALPQDVVRGVAFTIGFTVRQHGFTPLSGLDPGPEVTATRAGTADVVRSMAAPTGGPGHYTAQMTLPTSGEWDWGIQAFGPEPQPMPPILVSASGRAAFPVPAFASASLAFVAAGLATLGIALAFRRRLVVSGIALLLAALATGVWIAGGDTASAAAEAAPSGSVADGAALFLAKGCVVCHMNRDVAESESTTLSIGPDLSHYSNDPAFLARWLADPAAVRPAANMPDLGLSAEEIELLIAFLNGDGGA